MPAAVGVEQRMFPLTPPVRLALALPSSPRNKKLLKSPALKVWLSPLSAATSLVALR